MSKIILDLSGRGGLLERYQGDLNDTSASPHLRYLGGDNQIAEGLQNPFSYFGYMSPPNNTFTTITGTIGAAINSFAYNNSSGILFASEESTKILQFSDLEDTSVADYRTLSTGTIKDMVIYEQNGLEALVYAVDSGSSVTGSYVGWNLLNSADRIQVMDYPVLGGASEIDYEIVDTSSENKATRKYRKLAQEFNTADMDAKAISGVKIGIDRNNGTGSGITMKVSLQAGADANTSPYTSQGAWTDSTSYAINDTVTYSGSTFQCIQAHTSSLANDRPSTGSAWHDYWNFFDAPDGVEIASATVSGDSIASTGNINDGTEIEFDFGEDVTLTDTSYWLVFEESGSNMGTGDNYSWIGTVNNNGTYGAANTKGYITTGNYWSDLHLNASEQETLDFDIYYRGAENWSSVVANGAFTATNGLDQYLHLADNNLLYWVNGNQVHSIDGSITGGVPGTISEGLLVFPSYTSIPDIAETRGRIYLAVQTSERTTDTDTFFNAHRSGIFVWDRLSQIVGGSDFFPTPGAREIKNLFTSSTGDIIAITINNSGFCELRALVGNQFAVIQTMEKEAYPQSRRGIGQQGNFTTWLGRNGIFYAYGAVAPGDTLQLYKIGTTAGQTNFSVPGAIFVGNKDTSNNELAVYFGWTDTGPGYNISKWYPNGEGTIDSNAQVAGQGDVYTKVQQLPGLSTVQYIRGFHMPGGSDGVATVAATLKCYTNQSSTPAWSRSITYDDLAKGWFEKEWNKPNVNFLQFEIEWNTTPTLGTNTYRPMYLEIQTKDEDRINS